MINDSKIRDNLCLFPSATCNLNCRYCNISKNPALLKIDQELAKSFENPEYYLNRIKQYFPHPHSLKILEFWGGETFLNIERVFNLLSLIIEEYPYKNLNISHTYMEFRAFSAFCQVCDLSKTSNSTFMLSL